MQPPTAAATGGGAGGGGGGGGSGSGSGSGGGKGRARAAAAAAAPRASRADGGGASCVAAARRRRPGAGGGGGGGPPAPHPATDDPVRPSSTAQRPVSLPPPAQSRDMSPALMHDDELHVREVLEEQGEVMVDEGRQPHENRLRPGEEGTNRDHEDDHALAEFHRHVMAAAASSSASSASSPPQDPAQHLEHHAFDDDDEDASFPQHHADNRHFPAFDSFTNQLQQHALERQHSSAAQTPDAQQHAALHGTHSHNNALHDADAEHFHHHHQQDEQAIHHALQTHHQTFPNPHFAEMAAAPIANPAEEDRLEAPRIGADETHHRNQLLRQFAEHQGTTSLADRPFRDSASRDHHRVTGRSQHLQDHDHVDLTHDTLLYGQVPGPVQHLPAVTGSAAGDPSALEIAREHAALVSALSAPLNSWPAVLGDLHHSASSNSSPPVSHSEPASLQSAGAAVIPSVSAVLDNGMDVINLSNQHRRQTLGLDSSSPPNPSAPSENAAAQHASASIQVHFPPTARHHISTSGRPLRSVGRGTAQHRGHAHAPPSTGTAPEKQPQTSDVPGREPSASNPRPVSRLVFTAMPPAAPMLKSPAPVTPLAGPPTRGFRGSGGTIATKNSPPPTPASSAAARGIRKRARAAARAASCSPLPQDSTAADPATLAKLRGTAAAAVAAAANLPSDVPPPASKAAAVVSKQTANNRVVAALEHAKKNMLDVDGPELATLNKRAQRIIRTREAASRNRQEQKAKMTRLKTTNEALTGCHTQLELENVRLNAQLEQLRLLVNSPLLAHVAEVLQQRSSGAACETSSSHHALPTPHEEHSPAN